MDSTHSGKPEISLNAIQADANAAELNASLFGPRAVYRDHVCVPAHVPRRAPPVAVGTSDVTLVNLSGQPPDGVFLDDPHSDGKLFLAALVVKLKDKDISLTTINAWMSLEVLPGVLPVAEQGASGGVAGQGAVALKVLSSLSGVNLPLAHLAYRVDEGHPRPRGVRVHLLQVEVLIGELPLETFRASLERLGGLHGRIIPMRV